MLRFRHGMTVLRACLLSQTGMVLGVEAGALVKGTVAFRGTVPGAETMQVTADTELCGKEALIQAVQVNKDTLGLRHVVVKKTIVNSSPSGWFEAHTEDPQAGRLTCNSL